jgi:Leucine-rich repeat (LRR) protein
MRYRLLLLFLLLWGTTTVLAWTDDGYAEALRRIETARENDETSLYLSNLQLTRLPPEVGQLTSLELLYVSDNQLATLPSEIGNLNELVVIYAENNQITVLPPEIGNLTKLQALYVGENQLTMLLANPYSTTATATQAEIPSTA